MNQSALPPPGSGLPPATTSGSSVGLTLSFEAGFATHPGLARDHNEDAIWVTPSNHPQAATRGYLMIVADGMGGHNAGEVASQAAVRGVYERYYADAEPNVHRSLDNAVRRTNAELFNQAQGNPAQRGMGTTLTAAVIRGSRVYWAHVGDSRLYLIRGGQVEQLTHDHSWVEEQVRAGVLTRLQAEGHPQRNVITRALATNADVKVDHDERELQPGDVLVLCSDGLNTEVGDAQIAIHATKGATPKEAVDRLIQLANDNGGEDNISVAVIRITGGTEPLAVVGGAATATAKPQKRLPRTLILVTGGAIGLVALALVGALVTKSLVNPPSAQVASIPTASGVPAVVPTSTLAPITDAQPGGEAPILAAPLPPSPTAQPNQEPTATLAPLPTATNTAAPRRATPTPRTTPGSTGGSGTLPLTRRVPAPVPRKPNGSTEAGPGITFTWEPGTYTLRPGEGYAVLAWPGNDPQYQGRSGLELPTLHDACNPTAPHRATNLISDFPGLGKGPGEYRWTVVVVDTAEKDPRDPERKRCLVISEQPPALQFTYTGSAPGSSPGPILKPTPTPVPLPPSATPGPTP